MGLLAKFFGNARKPSGILGKIMIAGMNIFHSPVARWGLSRVHIPEPSEIAELGCGGGKNIRALLAKYPEAHVTGLDYSPLSVAKARRHNREAIASGRRYTSGRDWSTASPKSGGFSRTAGIS